VNAGRPVRPPRRHRTPRPLQPVTLSWVFYLPDPTRRRPGWAGGRASLPCAPHLESPPSWSDALSPPSPHGHHLCHYFLPTGQAGPGPPSGLCVPTTPPPRGAGLRGDQASWLFMKNPEPRLGARPTLPGLHPPALSLQGPGTTVAGPTQDQGAWASPLSQRLGGEMGASPHHTCGCSHIPPEYPRKNKTAELHSSQLLLQKRPLLPGVGEPGARTLGLGTAGVA
jgi:hypothetical protein